jgi:hypothetical protein
LKKYKRSEREFKKKYEKLNLDRATISQSHEEYDQAEKIYKDLYYMKVKEAANKRSEGGKDSDIEAYELEKSPLIWESLGSRC